MISRAILGLGLLFALAVVVGAQEEWTFLDNGRVRIGINRSAGGSIGWFSESGASENLLNYYDHGRYVQQSWYGDEDGSDWNGTPWRWNPVQGGGWQGEPAETLDWRVESKASVYARTQPRHWATGKAVDDVGFEQWISLDGPVARICYRMTYSGRTNHAPRHQELPAVFINGRHTTLVHYAGDAPWTGGDLARSIPGWPNETRQITEHWAAYIDPSTNTGLGVFVPVATEITCYRFGKPGAKDECSYFAPVKTLAVTAGLCFEYEVFITAGTVTEIRDRFFKLRPLPAKPSKE